MARLRPFFSYFGAKWRLAPKYPAPRFASIIEPFAGSACYSMLYSERAVTLIEKNPKVAAVWRYLIRATPAEILALPLDLRDDLEDGARWLIGFWMNGVAAAPAKQPSAWMRGGTHPKCFWGEHKRALIASQVDAIKHWQVVEGDFSRAPDVEATWFVDPPYMKAGKDYPCGAGDLDFQELGEWCRLLRGQVVVCENAGANWLPFEPFAETVGARNQQGHKKRTQEVVWLHESE